MTGEAEMFTLLQNTTCPIIQIVGDCILRERIKNEAGMILYKTFIYENRMLWLIEFGSRVIINVFK